MAQTIPNPYRTSSPLGDAFREASKMFFAGPTPIERERALAQAEAFAAQKDAARAKAALDTQEGSAYTGMAGALENLFAPMAEGETVDSRMQRLYAAATPYLVAKGRDPGKFALSVGAMFPQVDTGTLQRFRVGAGEAPLRPYDALTPADQVAAEGRQATAESDKAVRTEQAKPVSIGQDTIVRFAPNDPRAPAGGVATGQRSKSGVEGDSLASLFAAFAADPNTGLSPETYFTQSKVPSTARAYRTPDGRTGSTTDMRHDLHTGEALPPGTAPMSAQGTPDEVFGDPEMKKARENLLARRQTTINLANGINEFTTTLGEMRDPQMSLGLLGRSAGFLNDLRSQAEGMMRAGGVQIEAPRDAAAYADLLPAVAANNAALQSAMIDLAFLVANQREPGKLTDADVRNALVSLGGQIADPQVLTQIIRAKGARAIREYETSESVYRNQYGDRLNLAPWQAPQITGYSAPAAPGAAPPPAPAGRALKFNPATGRVE